MAVDDELREAVERILASPSRRKLVVAGPGAGKTTLFERLLEQAPGAPGDRLVLTFVNTLKADLAARLSEDSRVFTLHGYCFSLLKRHSDLRPDLPNDFHCLPGLTTLIEDDWRYLRETKPPKFLAHMRNLEANEAVEFYLERSGYYAALEFDDCVFRVHQAWRERPAQIETWELVLIDEYQDFNRLEAGLIDLLAERSPIVVAGDDDQALYSQLRGASWDFIRELHLRGDFEVFELPFCMRCTEVIVEAVNDVLRHARELGFLDGRIEKSYRYYAPHKGEDSRQYPQIEHVQCTVQSKRANYFGRYVAQQIAAIPEAEIRAAVEAGDIPVLVIAPKPYRGEVEEYLKEHGHAVAGRVEGEDGLTRERGLSLLKDDPDSSLGWRIVLHLESGGGRAEVRAGAEQSVPLVSVLPEGFREGVLAEAAALEDVAVPPAEAEVVPETQPIKVVSFEGAKGLSAHHVFVIGLHEGELPRNPRNIQDLEICKFVVALTRAKKRCAVLCTDRFAGRQRKWPSTFLSWITEGRFRHVRVSAQYWREVE